MTRTNSYYEDNELIAAEFALGLLLPEERAGAEQEYETNATFRALVDDWEEFFSPLAQSYGLHRAPEIWPTLKKELFYIRDNPLQAIVQHAAFLPILIGAKFSILFMLLSILIRR